MRSIHVIHSVGVTTANDTFTAENSCVTMTPHSTVVELTGGVKDGKKIRGAVYRDAHVVYVFEIEKAFGADK